ncbi:methylamine utilization protein MauJ [Stenotrophobium rhamnosiphilum]|uniref:ApeA N-terminal domain-containing protein n=1 Tax=Stenotrophobium rhamnosiphilum TaxID=2029166 RepID=A0A2T5MC34_9GAMM|nr:methylamine utilization protein MauJ [Stenotrophobium rhamnosiphilum]PTU30133.1 hypothetical protein CJD38_16465 [Stenotrophobium rhamnosiphilum]
MKTEWQFRFEAINFHFSKEHKYKGTSEQALDFGNGLIDNFEFEARIEPEKNQECPPGVEQVGDLYITVALGLKEAKPLAYWLAQYMTQQISFQSGQFRINYGLVSCKRIPETEEEAQELGDRLYSVEVHLEEIMPSPAFNSEQFQKNVRKPIDMRLLSQFNDAAAENNPIKKFLGFFRILESLFSGTRQEPLKTAFKSSDKLRRNFIELFPNRNFEEFVNTAVDVRHRCAHLKLEKSFGYAPIDPNVDKEVRPYLLALEELCASCMQDI